MSPARLLLLCLLLLSPLDGCRKRIDPRSGMATIGGEVVRFEPDIPAGFRLEVKGNTLCIIREEPLTMILYIHMQGDFKDLPLALASSNLFIDLPEFIPEEEGECRVDGEEAHYRKGEIMVGERRFMIKSYTFFKSGALHDLLLFSPTPHFEETLPFFESFVSNFHLHGGGGP